MFRGLRARTTVPLAAGEQFGSKWDFRQLIEAEWIDFARIDVSICGGLTEAKKIAGWRGWLSHQLVRCDPHHKAQRLPPAKSARSAY